MIFALGFLTAALIALVVFPAINARAERLARRRIEAQFPLSITELTAEKDHLRAEFAVLQRRLERKAEEALAGKHEDMEELGRRALRIQGLEDDVAARVIEALMFFGLGFLVAALIALLIIPAINARAERLTRRRLEALFPLSISELTAEKDHLRAEFAVPQRRLERKAEEALAERHESMDELGRRALRIEALETDLAARDAAIADDMVVVPIRSGVGARLGVNLGYLKFTPEATWNPF